MDVHPDSPLPIHPAWPLTVPLFYGIHYAVTMCVGIDQDDDLYIASVKFFQDT